MSEATLRGHRVYYEAHGEQGPPVLLVMGFGMSGVAWTPQVEDLRRDHRVVWYDNRGVGRSTAGEGHHGLPELAADAVALLDHLGWNSAHIVGVSMGGMVAQHLALDHRARVRSLTLIATHPAGLRHLPGRTGLRLFVRANTSRGEQRLDALASLLYPPEHRDRLRHRGWSPAMLAAVASPTDPRVRLQQLRSILGHDVRARLPELAGLPVLIFRPDRDVLVPPRGSDALAAGIPGARLVALPEGGHGATSQEAATINATLREHIAAAERACATTTSVPLAPTSCPP